jgi:hypothetical protein
MERRNLLSRLALAPLLGGVSQDAGASDAEEPTRAAPTQAAIGAALYPQTSAERVRGVTPVSHQYPEMNVMRYGARGDGLTDDAAAFQNAFDVAKVQGGTVHIPRPTAYYRIESSLDLTPGAPYVAGFNVKMDANPRFSPAFPQGTILLAHTGIGFDCTGNNALQFYDLCVTSRLDKVPTIAFLCARDSSGASMVHRFNNCRVYGYFSVAVYYNYGCEDDQLVGCYFNNYHKHPDAKTVVITTHNIFNIKSPHTKIYAGPASTLHHHFCGGDYALAGGHSTADVFYLDNCAFLHLERLWVECAGGRAIVYCDSTHGPSNFCTIFGMEVENGAAPVQGIVMPNPPTGRPIFVDWMIDACYFSSSGILATGTAVTLSSFKLRGLSALTGPGIVINGSAAYCTFDCDVTPIVIGTAEQCILMGSVENFKLAANIRCCFVDARSSRAWAPDTSTMAVQAGGTIRVTAVNSNVMGNQVEVTFTMQANTAMYCNVGALVTGLPFAPKNAGGGIVVVTDGTSDVAIGLGHIGADGIHLPAIATAGSPTSHAICVTARYFIA